MIKTIAIAAVSAIALASVARAAEAGADATLPPTFIVYKLAQDGIALRKLEAEGGIYEARVEATDGSIVKVGIDPQTAELTDAYSHARPRRADGAAPKVDAAQAVQAVAATGYWDVREIEFEKGGWEVKARDDDGRRAKFIVDAVTGTVR
ncbi:MAG: PepSY domain-containing protein [Pseudomonadota bacterium]